MGAGANLDTAYFSDNFWRGKPSIWVPLCYHIKINFITFLVWYVITQTVSGGVHIFPANKCLQQDLSTYADNLMMDI